MSTENVEIVREALGLIGARQGEPDPRLVQLMSPEVKLDFSRRQVNPDVYEGHAGALRALRDTDEIWEYFRVTPEQLIDAGDAVFVTETMRARGKGSGVETTSQIMSVWTVRDGRITQVTWYYDRQEALKAAGLAK